MEVMARYGGYRDAADVAWKMGRIMLKFRPIAPKPFTGGTATAGPIDAKSGKRKGGVKKESRRGRKRAKKAVAAEPGAFWDDDDNNNNSKNDSNNNTIVLSPAAAADMVTLPLMPVTPERTEEAPATPSPTASDVHVEAASCYFGSATWQAASSSGCSAGTIVVAPRPVRPVGSWVTVECVTDTWLEATVPTDLEKDTCPVFVSEPTTDREVTWTNEAYRRMVVGPGEGEGEEVRVALVTRGMVPAATCFTCRARVRYACRKRGGKVSVAVPCDVWRLGDGRLAWRLDVKAALSLGLGS